MLFQNVSRPSHAGQDSGHGTSRDDVLCGRGLWSPLSQTSHHKKLLSRAPGVCPSPVLNVMRCRRSGDNPTLARTKCRATPPQAAPHLPLITFDHLVPITGRTVHTPIWSCV